MQKINSFEEEKNYSKIISNSFKSLKYFRLLNQLKLMKLMTKTFKLD